MRVNYYKEYSFIAQLNLRCIEKYDNQRQEGITRNFHAGNGQSGFYCVEYNEEYAKNKIAEK